MESEIHRPSQVVPWKSILLKINLSNTTIDGKCETLNIFNGNKVQANGHGYMEKN